jgi:histone H2A
MSSRKRNKRKVYTFKSYIYKVLKQLHPSKGLSNDSAEQMNHVVEHFADKIADEAAFLAKKEHKKTITSHEIQTAVLLILPEGDGTYSFSFAKHAVNEGKKAVDKYKEASSKKKVIRKVIRKVSRKVSRKAGRKKSRKAGRKKSRKISRKASMKKTTKSKKAGLVFPVARFKTILKNRGFRIGEDAPVFLAGVMEYITSEILELAGNSAKDNRKTIITSRHLQLGSMGDEALNGLFGRLNLTGGGVVPHIHAALRPRPWQVRILRKARQARARARNANLKPKK